MFYVNGEQIEELKDICTVLRLPMQKMDNSETLNMNKLLCTSLNKHV